MESLVPLFVILPLGVAFLVVILAHVRPLSRAVGPLSFAAILANAALAVSVLGVEMEPLYVGKWSPDSVLGIAMVCDGLAKLMLVTINFVAAAALIYAGAYMRRFTKVWLFYALFLLMTGAMNAVVLAGDLFNMFVFLEIAAISSYALVAFGCESEELEAAFKYLIMGTVGSACILLGVAVLYALTGQLNMARVGALLPGEVGPAVLFAAAALLAGLALKAAMVPFHAWLPDAHPSAPAPISAMLSGVLIKAIGVYALARIVFNVLGPTTEYGTILVVLGAASMVIGVFLAVGQWDLKRLLAYHSISQMGYVVLALGVGAGLVAEGGSRGVAALCLLGALFHMFNHAAFK
ncbi:MAG: complex I subunit 5 family protein, partial [Planctomycetota bacterium]